MKDDSKEPTEIFGLQLQSEFKDVGLYHSIRSLQFVLAFNYNIRENLKIEEIQLGVSGNLFFYTITNTDLKLTGYIGRAEADKKITYLALDNGMRNWMYKEGFEDTPENCEKFGTILQISDVVGLAKFLAGKSEYRVLRRVIKS